MYFSIVNRTFRFLVWKTDTVPSLPTVDKGDPHFVPSNFLGAFAVVVIMWRCAETMYCNADKMCFYFHAPIGSVLAVQTSDTVIR